LDAPNVWPSAAISGRCWNTLIKLQGSPATEPGNGWKASVLHARRQIRRTLEDSPSLRREVAAIIPDETAGARQDVLATLAIHRELPIVPIEARRKC
jgi:hypothetical protein